MADKSDTRDDAQDLDAALGGVEASTARLTGSSNAFANAMTRAFTQASAGGRQLDDVLKGLALRMSNLAVAQAFKPIAMGLTSGLNTMFSGLFGGSGGTSAPSASAGAGAGSVAASMTSVAGPNVNVHISTPDLASFRRSEAYLTGQIARAVARGQRSM